MQIKLIHSTESYHKLVETVARVCYQSYHKDDVNSHNFIKAIMSNGHISVSSVGSMVFKIDTDSDTLFKSLLEFKQVNRFINITLGNDNYLSMNMLSYLDLINAGNNSELSFAADSLLYSLKQETDKVPCIRWFYDKSIQLPEEMNKYTAKSFPSLYKPIVLDEDYTILKSLGLNEYELSKHATITMNFMTDRSASLQFWRHWSGGCELSQRYVERGSAEFRDMVGLNELLEVPNPDKDGAYGYLKNCLLQELLRANETTVKRYERIMDLSSQLGIRKGRAKEIARSILPNNITTQLIQSRPYENWVHLFKLRDSNHAQKEIREDVLAMKEELRKVGVDV